MTLKIIYKKYLINSKSVSKYLIICDYGIDLFDENTIKLIERIKKNL